MLPGVTVTVTQTDTGLVGLMVTNDTGAFALPISCWWNWLKGSLNGFFNSAHWHRPAGEQHPGYSSALSLGDIAEDVQIVVSTPLIDTRTPGVGTVVESQRIVELPLNARQVTQR